MKSGISHRWLRPSQAIVDPLLAATMPAEVCALRPGSMSSVTRRSPICRCRTRRARHPRRPTTVLPYQGANPVADVWSAQALEYGGRYLRRAVSGDVEARGAMMLAATMAGVGFGSAGVHIPHACAYPIAGLKHVYEPPGYETDHPFVPHGISVIVTAPAAFRFTYSASPERHERAASLLGSTETGPEALPDALRALMTDLGIPSLSELGYDESDIPDLVEGALAQQRLLVGTPRPVGPERPRVNPAREFAQLSHESVLFRHRRRRDHPTCASPTATAAAPGAHVGREDRRDRRPAARPDHHLAVARDRPRHERGGETGRPRNAPSPLPRRVRGRAADPLARGRVAGRSVRRGARRRAEPPPRGETARHLALSSSAHRRRHDDEAAAQRRRGTPRPCARPARRHDPRRHPRDHRPPHPRRPRRRPHTRTNSPTSSTRPPTADASSRPQSATPWTASSGAASCTCSSARSSSTTPAAPGPRAPAKTRS